MTEDRARSLGLPYVLIAGAVERHNAYAGRSGDLAFRRRRRDATISYEQAGVGPDAIDFVEAYDDYPVMVMLELEALGFSRPGEAVSLVREKNLTLDGDLPVNTSGGMLSLGQAGAGARLPPYQRGDRAVDRAARSAGLSTNAGIRARELSWHRQLRSRSSAPARPSSSGAARHEAAPRSAAACPRPCCAPADGCRGARRFRAAGLPGLRGGRLSAAGNLPQLPVRPSALAGRLAGRQAAARSASVHHSTDAYFTRHRPLIMGTVQLDAGPVVITRGVAGLRHDRRAACDCSTVSIVAASRFSSPCRRTPSWNRPSSTIPTAR